MNIALFIGMLCMAVAVCIRIAADACWHSQTSLRTVDIIYWSSKWLFLFGLLVAFVGLIGT